MLLELVTACALISPWNLHDREVSAYLGQVSLELKSRYTLDNPKVVFEMYCPKEVLGFIRQEADESGWNVSIEEVNYFIWKPENTYKFTFTSK